MTITYEEETPSLIENTTMVKGMVDGIHSNYQITPVSGYVIHDKAADWEDVDPDTGDVLATHLGYKCGTVSCGANYDFVANPREFYAVPENSVPADNIFGVGNNHEIM